MLFFEHHEVEVVEVQKVVGYTLDSKLTWGPMINTLAKKARMRLAALVRLKPMLDNQNLKTMYTMFIRSIMEYGSIAWMGAADSHLKKLDRVQAAAERVGGFTVEALGLRRKAAAVAFALKLMAGKTKGILKEFVPTVHDVEAPSNVSAAVRSKKYGCLMPRYTDRVKGHASLGMYKRGFWGVLPEIWSTLSQDLVYEGRVRGWLKIKSRCTRYIMYGELPKKIHRKSKTKKESKCDFIPENYSTKLNNELNVSAPVFVPTLAQCA